MKLKTSLVLLAAFVAATPPALAQGASAGRASASPFGPAPARVAPEATGALSEAAARKAQPHHLQQLLASESNDLIVEYETATPPAAYAEAAHVERLAARKGEFERAKRGLRAVLSPTETQSLADYDALPMEFVRVHSRAALVKLLNHTGVKAVHENAAHSHMLAESLPLARVPKMIASGMLGAGTTVAVIDTGVNYTLPDFGKCTAPGAPAACRVAAAVDFAPQDSALDANGHGTNVAAIVAGVAPAARIAALDVFTGDVAYSANIIGAINWSIINKAALNIVAMNLSLGSPTRNTSACPTSWAATPFANARAAGIVPVVAAGNSGFADGVAEPACVPGSLRVGAVYDANLGARTWGTLCTDAATAADRVTCFSNGGNLLTLFAPGAMITAGNLTQAGTSQATPHVAGAIAVLRSPYAAPQDSLDKTIARLTASGKPVTDARNGIQKPRLDLTAALEGIVPSAWEGVVQQLYVAYLGRPADPGGLNFWAGALRGGNAPLTAPGLNDTYTVSAVVRSVIDGFANSAESTAFYSGAATTKDFVNKVYVNLFNRNADAGGLAYWSNAIDNGGLGRAQAILAIMCGALANNGLDTASVQKKSAVAANFTNIVDTSTEVNAFLGSAAQGTARSMLATVNATTDVQTFQSIVASTLASIVASQR